MCNQDTVNFLKQYRDNELEIDRLEEEIDRWSNAATKVTASLGNEIRSPSGDSILQKSIEQIAELQAELSSVRMDAIGLRRLIEKSISTTYPENLRMILRYKYIDGITYERVAEKMHKTARHIQYLHEIAINRVVIPKNNIEYHSQEVL